MISFAILLLVYYIVSIRTRKYLLLMANILFYLSFGVNATILIGLSVIVVYFLGVFLDIRKDKKKLLVLSLVLMIGVLGVLKYSALIVSTLNFMIRLIGFTREINNVSLILPIGLSFYTFQATGYLIDVYRGSIKVERNFIKLAAFLTFFPSILSGPILRAEDILPQIEKKSEIDYGKIKNGLLLFGYGVFQKLVVADRIGIIVDQAYGNYMAYKGFLVAIIAVLYSLQIYFDFAGYSNMAIGISGMLNISIKANFNTPYFSQSITEFWRRWHISLSSWLRDYIYIPLGGNRKGHFRKLVNIMIVFFVSGLWHGAAWRFVLWGCIHGLFQIVENLFQKPKEKLAMILHIDLNRKATKLISVVCTFFWVSLAWIFFRSEGIHQAIRFIANAFKEFNIWIFFDGTIYNIGLSQKEMLVLLVSLLICFVISICHYRGLNLIKIINGQQMFIRWIVYLLLIFAILIYGIYGSNYNASDFIYFKF